jgi:hypothetical protein
MSVTRRRIRDGWLLRKSDSTRRTTIAFGMSTVFHVLVLFFLLSQAAPIYEVPESVAPPMDTEIIQMEEPPPRIVVVPKPVREPKPPKPEPPTPAPPKPEPPQPAPPLPQTTAAPPPPKPPPPAVAKPTPATIPRLEPKPLTIPPLASAPPVAPAAPATPAPAHMNIHKPEKEAPASVPTLPFAPAAGPAASAPSAAAPSGEPDLGGSRLKGLTPYPYGAMPSGGSGLRGSLVGCANADAVTLSPVERARCNARFGTSIGSAPTLDPISPTKRAAYDKAAERQARDTVYRDSTPNREPAHPLSSGAGDTSRGPSSVIPTAPPR